jgi:hypothetical protein
MIWYAKEFIFVPLHLFYYDIFRLIHVLLLIANLMENVLPEFNVTKKEQVRID